MYQYPRSILNHVHRLRLRRNIPAIHSFRQNQPSSAIWTNKTRWGGGGSVRIWSKGGSFEGSCSVSSFVSSSLNFVSHRPCSPCFFVFIYPLPCLTTLSNVIRTMYYRYGPAPNNSDSAINVLLDVVQDQSGKKDYKMDHYATRFPTNVVDIAGFLVRLLGTESEFILLILITYFSFTFLSYLPQIFPNQTQSPRLSTTPPPNHSPNTKYVWCLLAFLGYPIITSYPMLNLQRGLERRHGRRIASYILRKLRIWV